MTRRGFEWKESNYWNASSRDFQFIFSIKTKQSIRYDFPSLFSPQIALNCNNRMKRFIAERHSVVIYRDEMGQMSSLLRQPAIWLTTDFCQRTKEKTTKKNWICIDAISQKLLRLFQSINETFQQMQFLLSWVLMHCGINNETNKEKNCEWGCNLRAINALVIHENRIEQATK